VSVEKLCGCEPARWPKCAHPWYLPKFRWQGQIYKPNLTRYAIEVLGRDGLDTKTEADALADDVRAAIRAGTYVSAKTTKNTVRATTDGTAQPVVISAAIATFVETVIDQDTDKLPQQKGRDRYHLDRFAAFTTTRGAIGALPVAAVDADDLIAFRRSAAIVVLAHSSWAKFRTSLVMFFNWAKSKGRASGYVDRSPFDALAPHQKKALKRGKFAKRSRRVDRVEEAALLKAAGRARDESTATRLQSLIIAAIESGLRLGELLALQWLDVDFERRSIYVRAELDGARKTGKARYVPISDRLDAELRALPLDPTGQPWPRTAFVFGNAIGERVTTIAKAWESTVLRAHGVEPVWVAQNKLSPVCRAKLRAIGLHFHDLRHEAATRWYLDDGWGLAEIRDALGHSTVAQTETYLNIDSAASPAEAMRRADARRAQQQQAAVAAAAVPRTVRRVPKLSQNAGSGDRAASALRLVSGGKLVI